MRRQKCTKCGSLLDVSRLEKGSKFACATCGAVLVVGETVAVKRSLKEGPAFKPRASKPEPVVTPTRPRRAPPAEAPRRERRAPEERAPAKSKAPLFLGLAALVVSGVIIAIVASRGSGGGGGGSSGGGGGGGGSGGLTAARWWDQTSALVGAADEAGLKQILEDARRHGFDGDPAFWGPKADHIYRALLKHDEDSAEANRYFGRKSLKDYPGFDGLWSDMIEHYKVLPERFRDFFGRYEATIESGKQVWLDADGYSREAALLGDFDAWKKELAKDPSPEQIEKALANSEGFAKDFGAVPVMARPWLVLLASRRLRTADDSDAEKERLQTLTRAFESRGEKIAKTLSVVFREFNARFGGPLGLEPIGTDKVLRLWVSDDLTAYQALVRMQSRGAEQGGDPTYFSARSRWAYGYASDNEAEAQYLANDLAAGAVQQLQWYYSKDPKKPFEDYFTEWNGYWFTVGLSEYLGSGAREDSFTGFSPRSVAQLRKMKDNQMPMIPVRHLVEQKTRQAYERYWSDVFWPTHTSDDNFPEAVLDLIRAEPPGFHMRAFRAQAWYLAYFLNEYGQGKYRKQFQDLLMTALRGRNKPAAYGSGRWNASHEAFADIMGLKSAADWERLEGEYKDHISSALSAAQ